MPQVAGFRMFRSWKASSFERVMAAMESPAIHQGFEPIPRVIEPQLKIDFASVNHLQYMGGVHFHWGTPQNGWFIVEHPIEVDDDWGYPYDFLETQ